MSHKGYTIPYFIRFFQSIPSSKWTCGSLTNSCNLNEGEERAFKACAMGFAGAFEVEEVEDNNGKTYFKETKAKTPARMHALSNILNGRVESINDDQDDSDGYGRLGKTPRARILKALKLRKKYGTKWEDKI